MVGFQEVVEIWEVYWFGRRLGRWRREFLFCKVEKGRLKMGFRRPLGGSLEDRIHPTYGLQVLYDL
jgi:hypothetical protein